MVKRGLVVGATGYIGQHVVRALAEAGHEVVAFARPRSGVGGRHDESATRAFLPEAEVRFGDVTDPVSLAQHGFRGEPFDFVVSCLATRTGAVADAWRIERDAQLVVLRVAQASGVEHFVLLSAICVQRPRLAFQHAKLAFEAALIGSGVRYSIVRPTAFFKSLAGQVEKVKAGKPFVMIGDGERTACKPIGERDLARYMATCLTDPAKHDAILPIGGPGPAITPKVQGALLAAACGREPKYRKVPVAMLDAIVGGLSLAGRVSAKLRDKAELARIGRYYATESMLVWDEVAGRYDADKTPSFGDVTLQAFYEAVVQDGLAGQELGDHALF